MLKNSLLALALVAMMASCNNNTSSSVDSAASTESADSTNANSGVMEIENNTYEFGTVKEGAVIEHVFNFKNTGTAPVILAQVSASCGCTTPEYTTDPVLPGKEGVIKVSFNTAGQVGVQQKIVTISSNASNPVQTVQLKGTVEK